jgi:hypothetical protein
MRPRKTIRIQVFDLLKLVDEAILYEHDSDVFYAGIAKLLSHKLSNEEIEAYCSWYVSIEGDIEGYDKQDYEEAKSRLEEFRELFCKVK